MICYDQKVSMTMLYRLRPSDLDYLHEVAQTESGQRLILQKFASLLNKIIKVNEPEIDHVCDIALSLNELPIWKTDNIKYFVDLIDTKIDLKVFIGLFEGLNLQSYLKIRFYLLKIIPSAAKILPGADYPMSP